MNQSLSAPTGAGSLMNIGRSPSVGSEAVAQGAGGGFQTVESFDRSLQEANQQRSTTSVDTAKSGQALPGGGDSLPSGDVDEREVSPAEVNAVSGSDVDQIETDEPLQNQVQQELFNLVDKNFKEISSPSSEGDSTLQQINQYRGADLSVMTDSALKQMNRVDRKSLSSVQVVDSLGKATAGSSELTGAAVPAAGVDSAGYSLEYSQQITSSDLDRRAATSAESGAATTLTGTVSAGSNADLIPAVSPVGGQNGKADLLAEAVRVESEETDSTSKKSILPTLPQTSGMTESLGVKQGSAERAEAEPVKTIFADSVAQIVKEAELANKSSSDSVIPAAGSLGEAVQRAVAAAEVRGAVDTSKGEVAKAEGGGKAEVSLRNPPAEPISQQVTRQTTDSAIQSANVLQGGPQVADNLRQQVKSEAEVDKLKGADLTGRTGERHETLLTSFADSLSAAGKVRSTAEPLQLVMPEGVRPGMQAWGPAVNNRIMMMASQNGQFAEIQLDPPELGSLQVKLHIKHDQVSVVFNTPHGSVREAIEQNMPRLREMFAEQGLDLAESSVNEQREERQGQQNAESENAFVGYQGRQSDESGAVHQETVSLVDYYA